MKLPKFKAIFDGSKVGEVLTINFETGNIVVDMGWEDVKETQRWDALIPKGEYYLLQSTGLSDCNGREIFERDIINFYLDDNGKYLEVTKEDNGGWIAKRGKEKRRLNANNAKFFEVVNKE